MKKAKKTIAGMESLFEIRQYDMKIHVSNCKGVDAWIWFV